MKAIPDPAAAAPACRLERRASYTAIGAAAGTLAVYRKDLKQLQFDLASATGESALLRCACRLVPHASS